MTRENQGTVYVTVRGTYNVKDVLCCLYAAPMEFAHGKFHEGVTVCVCACVVCVSARDVHT